MMKCYVFPILLLCLIYVPLKGQYGSAYNSDTTLVPGADTEDLAYLFQKARSLSELGNHLAAILTYQEILKIEPRNETALIELGEIAFRIDNWYLSVATMRELIALNPEDVESRRVMVEIFRTFRETAEELKVVFELVQINPSDTALLYRLSTLYEEHALYPEQAEVLEYLIELEPQEEAYYRQLADVYCQHLHKVKKCIRTYERLLEIQPHDIEILSLLALKYGEEDGYGKQITYYQKIHDLAIDTIYWKEVLFHSYWQALKYYDLRFNVPEARDQCKSYIKHSGERDDLNAVYEGLECATKPLAGYRTALRGFDFAGRTNHWRNVLSIGFLGPFPGSSISVENNYTYIRQDYEPYSPGEYAPGLMESHLYRGRVMFDQRFSNFSMHVDAGLHQPISGPSDTRTHFISTARINYQPFENSSVSASYDLDMLTVNPIALAQQIRQQQIFLGMQYSFLKDFLISADYRRSFLSDNNTHSNANIRLEYNLIQTLLLSDDIEAKHPLGYNYMGTNISVGIQYGYLDYAMESYIYPTVLNEHQISTFALIEKQLIQSFVGRAEAFLGITNYQNMMWGYNLTLEKNISWRLSLFLQWDHFLSPYSIGNTHYTNSESTIQLGIISRF